MEPLPSFAALVATIPPLAHTLLGADDYHAHRARVAGGPAETLAEHMARVMSYFQRLTQAHGLDAVADQLAYDAVPDKIPAAQRQRLAGHIKALMVRAIWYHDYGKVNEQFQADKMLNPARPGWPVVAHGYTSHHSVLSAYFYAMQGLGELLTWPDKQEANVLMDALLAFTYPIERHHSSTLSDGLLEHTSFQAPAHALAPYLSRLGIDLSVEQLAGTHRVAGIGHHQVADKLEKMGMRPARPSAHYALLRLTFSLLTAADYYATGHYYNSWDDAQPYNDFGLLTGELREKVIRNARTKQPYNRAVLEKLDEWSTKDPAQWQQPSNENLNNLRSRMAAEVVQQVRTHADKRLFYLHAPTGGGKTNLSMLAAAELLAANPELNKIFYVFPFTTLITQTWQALRDTLGLTADEVIQLHSRADYARRAAPDSPSGEDDAVYDQNHHDELDNLFVNFPVCLLTHIRFVDVLKTSRKDSNYLLHRLANSIVILDELQSYDPQHWDKLAWLLSEYAHVFNIRFVLMSATLPKLGNLLVDKTIEFTELLPEARDKYFLNPNFKGRVRFDFSLCQVLPTPDRKDQEARKEYLRSLAAHLHETSEKWATEDKGKVRTVIEFIFKKTASEFFALLEAEELLPGYTLVVLSGTILEPRRRDVIQFLKNPPADCPKVLLITTQVVEAGVDIDMDLGYKDRSLLDSEEQLAGRINRNAGKTGSVLYLFDLDAASVIYDKDKRYKAQESKAMQPQAEAILNEKNFEKLYALVMQDIKKWNSLPAARNLSTYQGYFRKLDFPAADRELKLIDQETQSVFAPLSVALYGQEFRDGAWVDRPRPVSPELLEQYAILTEAQQEFLQASGVSLTRNRLHGADVLDLYEHLRKPKSDKAADDNKGKMKLKQDKKRLQGIRALFMFSLFAQSRDMRQLQNSHRAHDHYGFWTLEEDNLKELYEYDSGIRSEILEFEAGALMW